jgi:AcrR family transcriptional regulator
VPRPRQFETGAVLDAAAAVFRERGYAATSLDDVIGRTEVGRASLYNAFGGKRALFLAALDRYVDAALAGALGRLGQPGSARAAIEDCLRDAVSFDLADEACGGCLLATPPSSSRPTTRTSGAGSRRPSGGSRPPSGPPSSAARPKARLTQPGTGRGRPVPPDHPDGTAPGGQGAAGPRRPRRRRGRGDAGAVGGRRGPSKGRATWRSRGASTGSGRRRPAGT